VDMRVSWVFRVSTLFGMIYAVVSSAERLRRAGASVEFRQDERSRTSILDRWIVGTHGCNQ